MNNSGLSHDDSRTAGFALFAVLSFSLLAATISAPFLLGSRTRALVARNVAVDIQANVAGRSLLHVAVVRLIELSKTPDFVLPGKITCQLGPASLTFSFQGHGGLIDLNHASEELLLIGFGALGYRPADASKLAAAVLEFRRIGEQEMPVGTENVRGGFKRAGFETVSELRDFKGIAGKAVSDLHAVFTVHNGSGTIYADQASNTLQRAMRTTPESQMYFVVQGRAALTAFSISAEVSHSSRTTYQATATVRSDETPVGYSFLSPIKVEPVAETSPVPLDLEASERNATEQTEKVAGRSEGSVNLLLDRADGECLRFFSRGLLETARKLVAIQ